MSGIERKDAYAQYVEMASDVRPFVAQLERLLQPSDSSDSDSDSDESPADNERKRGDRFVNGVMTTKEERRNERARAYNLSAVGKDRQWLQDALLSSSESSEDDTAEGKERRIKDMIREHRIYRKYSSRYQKNKSKYRYMYFGAGLVSHVDRYSAPERGGRAPGGRGRRGRPPARGGDRVPRGAYRPRRGRAKDGRTNATHDTPGSMQEGLLDWEDQLHNVSGGNESFDNVPTTTLDKPSSTRGRKKLSTLKTPEALTALRRRHWQVVVKKDLGKVQRARTANHKEAVLQSKRLATACAKHWRNVANHSQKNMKETVWRCKRLSKEMQAYWKRYDRAERDTRRRMEREAEEQRKMDVELMEAKRQRRKLNFLITQTELYAHFMQRKNGNEGDNGTEQILRHLDEDTDPRLAAIDVYDSEAMKAQASRNAREAFRAERARTQLFDSRAGVTDVEVEGEVEVENEVEETESGEHPQPSIFQGTLKGYQLKGMNWLASLYDQGISGILADEMGLGKTVQCIAFLCHVAEKLGVWGPFLVVSPASTLHNWQQEVERFAPHFKVVPYWGSPGERRILRQFWERKDLHTPQAAFHVVVTSYQIVVSDLKYLNRITWQYMILDEAQAIKSSSSMRWKQLLGFSCRNRLLLSGTPIQNSMAELWALLHFIMPTLFDSHDEFNEWFSKDIESHAENKTTMDEKHLSRLHMILKPFMLRRIKKDVENELSDKIEIMVHCPLTIRQKLLYIALKKKIRIEDLLHVTIGTETGHNVDKNFTSNLMNLVMQFRKVCNHPELFERRDVRSPFSMHVDDYHIPKIVAEECMLVRAIPSQRHLLYNKLSILTPDYIHDSLRDGGVGGEWREGGLGGEGREGGLGGECFAFTRLMDLSPMEVYRVMLCGWLYAMNHIEDCLEKYDRIRHRQFWWSVKETDTCAQYDRVGRKHMLLVCPDGDVLKQRKEDGLMWRELLFTDPIWMLGPFYTFTDYTLHCMPETVEHRVLRMKHLRGNTDFVSEIKTEDGEMIQVKDEPIEELRYVERPARVYPLTPTPLPQFLFTAQPKVCCHTRAGFAVSRSFAHAAARHASGARALHALSARAIPPRGWAYVQVPDKNQLVSDAGKLTVLDSLLKRLKETGHRVLIYSQMTKMIDLLEEYMWHRKHKYMRLDGSSKISARRDMVADFQARTDIFVFLLSTRAGGLGINLTAADTVIFYDSDWNPTVDQQAMDRAHRLGQTKQVTVYRLICQGTIEERIMQRAREKSEIQRMVISGGNFKPETLKPKEVVSLLLDDEEIELKYRQKSEEKKREERERKRKIGLPSSQAGSETPPMECKRSRDSSEPTSPLRADRDPDSADTPLPPAAPLLPAAAETTLFPRVSVRGSRAARRGRPRGVRHAVPRRPPDAPPAHTHPPTGEGQSSVSEGGRGRRGPGRPRGATRASAPARRPRRPRDPLLVPLAPPP